jgi:LuxR family quorum-sensing system transcriptional regulator CciR
MRIDNLAIPFKRIAEMTTTVQELLEAMAAITMRLGFQHFAIANHLDITLTESAIRLHNYPSRWAEHYDRKSLVYIDPVLRRSHLTMTALPGPRWDALLP